MTDAGKRAQHAQHIFLAQSETCYGLCDRSVHDHFALHCRQLVRPPDAWRSLMPWRRQVSPKNLITGGLDGKQLLQAVGHAADLLSLGNPGALEPQGVSLDLLCIVS